MQLLLQLFIWVPVLGFVATLLIPRKQEPLISGIAIAATGVQLGAVVAFITGWIREGMPVLDVKQLTLYQSPDFEFFIDFLFDKTTAVFALIGALITFLIAIFSRFYLHREEGFKRFFSTLLLFFTGYNLLIFSGNFETLFVGWELLGITSFLLIAFYRDRYLPVKNGFKVLSFYRLGDICLMLAMWMSHHLWHKNITFSEWTGSAIAAQYEQHYTAALFVAVMVFVAAAIKSAQFPFFTWLPRAMEGPTSSSAIFYGSLSVHIGAFLLLRTAPFWEEQVVMQGIIIGTGLVTSLLASGIARVQSSVKTQIAYSSITQLGLIFVEIGLGFHGLALIHFAGNAFLRTYQLLVSPSVLSYRIHDMFFSFTPRPLETSTGWWKKLHDAVYVLNIKEWNLDGGLTQWCWAPFKWLGRQMHFISTYLVGALLTVGFISTYFKKEIGGDWASNGAIFLAVIALILILKSFADRGDARHAWLLVIVGQFFTACSIFLNNEVEVQQILWYISGSVFAAALGYICLNRINALDKHIDLSQYHGYSYEQPGIALVFLLACLGLAGFPISPTFIGIDLMFTHIDAHQVVLIALTGLIFLFTELAVLRIYTRVFLGQHKKMYHPVAFRSS